MLLLIILLILVTIIIKFKNSYHFEIAIAAVFLIAGLFVLIIGSILTHSDDLALVRKGKPLIEIREQAIKDIDNQLNKLEYNHTALMNADTPAKSLIETKSEYVDELTYQKLKIQRAKIKIEARSIGFFKLVVWLYGKE
jgi:hypothetical protein